MKVNSGSCDSWGIPQLGLSSIRSSQRNESFSFSSSFLLLGGERGGGGGGGSVSLLCSSPRGQNGKRGGGGDPKSENGDGEERRRRRRRNESGEVSSSFSWKSWPFVLLVSPPPPPVFPKMQPAKGREEAREEGMLAWANKPAGLSRPSSPLLE